MNSDSNLFQILLRNNKEELKEFLISNGKGPKPICPIIFLNKGDKNNEQSNE